MLVTKIEQLKINILKLNKFQNSKTKIIFKNFLWIKIYH